MAVEKIISTEKLDYYSKLSKVKYTDLYKSVISKCSGSEEDKGKEDLSSLVNKYSRLYGSIFHAVNDNFKNEVTVNTKVKRDFLTVYSAYIASRAVHEDARNVGGHNKTQSLFIGSKSSYDNKVISRGSTEYTTVRMALENMVLYAKDRESSSIEAIRDYFSFYSNQANNELKAVTSDREYAGLNGINWIIGPYQVKGTTPIVQPQNGKRIRNIDVVEKGQFHTPLTYLHIPKDKVLRRDRIVGSQEVLTFLERQVKCLFLYNPKVRRNPMKDRKKFQNKIMIQGMPGGGKGAASFYTINYAEEFNRRVNGNLMVCCFGIDSSFEDGKIQKLKSQLKQITTDNRPFLIYEDETDGMLKKEARGVQKKQDLQVIQEFNKFFEGQYADRGNYLFIGNINDIKNLSPANRRRFYEINWQGAVSRDEKTQMFEYKLEEGVINGYIELSQRDFKKLGDMAYEIGLTGADITTICEKVGADAFKWDNLGEIYELRNDYEKQLMQIDQNHNRVNFDMIEKELNQFIGHKKNSDRESEKLHLMQY